MYIFDIETMGIESNSAILSLACIYFNPEEKPTYEQLVDSAFFVKLDAKDQIQRLNRVVSRSTLEWWKKQPVEVQNFSLLPSEEDLKAEDALVKFALWVNQFPDYKSSTIWARGNLDQMCLGSLETELDRKPILHFSRWRDVRTAVDLLTGSNNGYCSIPNFDESKVIKHNPIHDCAYDAMMLMYGSHQE